MEVFTLRSELWTPRPVAEVFRFFADARNLEALTPPWLRFKVLSPEPVTMRPGTRIDYRLRLRGLPLRWQSEITVWDPPRRFVDEQRRGPYRLWIHEHVFEERGGGTICRDQVRYAVLGGALVNRWLVRPDLNRIFEYRRRRLTEILGEAASPSRQSLD
jgi:ligand-binding SRPBCC domain-containing protein